MYADFECILRPNSWKGVKSSDKNKVSYTEKYQDHIPCSFVYNFLMLTINSIKMLFFIEQKMLFTILLKQFLKSMTIAKK